MEHKYCPRCFSKRIELSKAFRRSCNDCNWRGQIDHKSQMKAREKRKVDAFLAYAKDTFTAADAKRGFFNRDLDSILYYLVNTHGMSYRKVSPDLFITAVKKDCFFLTNIPHKSLRKLVQNCHPDTVVETIFEIENLLGDDPRNIETRVIRLAELVMKDDGMPPSWAVTLV